MDLMDELSRQLRKGLVTGPTLYLTQKMVSASDSAAKNLIGTGLPQEIRTPLVGLGLAALTTSLFDGHWYAEKVAEYMMANAVAQALFTAGAQGRFASGPLDQQVNALFVPIARIGLPSGPPSPISAPAPVTGGYMRQPATRGYVGRPATAGASSTAGFRRPLRGMTTELR